MVCRMAGRRKTRLSQANEAVAEGDRFDIHRREGGHLSFATGLTLLELLDALPVIGHACGHNLIAGAALSAVAGTACPASRPK